MSFDKKNPLYQEDLNYILSTKGIEQLRNKSILITGATGLIGVCLIDALMSYNEQGAGTVIYAVGRSRETAKSRLGEYYDSQLFHFIEQDVRQPFPSSLHVDYIVPLASNTHPLAYSQYPVETIEINVKGAEHALNKAKDCGAMVLYPSTVEVYGNARGADVFTEDYTGQLNLATSRSCYTESKRVSEALCQSYISEYYVDVKVARLSRVFGPTMLVSDSKASSQFILNALNGQDIVLKSKGEQFFSYIYVADAVCALLHIMLHGATAEAYNIANPACNIRLREFAEACAAWSKRKVIFDLPSATERAGYSIAMKAIQDIRKLQAAGWNARYDFNNAICRTLNILADK